MSEFAVKCADLIDNTLSVAAGAVEAELELIQK
jgi:hypothetical protein